MVLVSVFGPLKWKIHEHFIVWKSVRQRRKREVIQREGRTRKVFRNFFWTLSLLACEQHHPMVLQPLCYRRFTHRWGPARPLKYLSLARQKEAVKINEKSLKYGLNYARVLLESRRIWLNVEFSQFFKLMMHVGLLNRTAQCWAAEI